MSADDASSYERANDIEIVRTQNPYSLSMEELYTRQIAMNSRKEPRGGSAFAKKFAEKEKNNARSRVVALFKNKRWPGRLRILTLPGAMWEFEYQLLAVRDSHWFRRTNQPSAVQIVAAELDPGIYAAACATIPRKTGSPIVNYPRSPNWTARTIGTDVIDRFHNCDAFSLMEFNRQPFDAAWLDFTGSLTPDRIERLSTFYRDWITDVMVVTFLSARQSAATSLDIAEAGGEYQWLTRSLPGKVIYAFHYINGPSRLTQFAVSKNESQYSWDSVHEDLQWSS